VVKEFCHISGGFLEVCGGEFNVTLERVSSG